ncbi:urease accessory protein UreF [Embleya sp. AB8]|uniref:urease accessory protein UreF n=1 Tax=Embleya sp. AB8 TaxID=3156304 RepID=UPI003C758EC2
MSTPAGSAAHLVTLQLTDSAFPSGLYTLSHGLEGYAQARAVDRATLSELLADLLRHTVGPADTTALVLAHRAARAADWAGVRAVDERLYASKLGREQRVAATRTGRQLLDLTPEVFADAAPRITPYADLVAGRSAPGCQAIVAGVVYAATGVPEQDAATADLFAFCASFTGAALRLRLADHRSAQVVLRAAAPLIEEVVAAARRRELLDLGGCVPLADVMAGRHERAEARLFAS